MGIVNVTPDSFSDGGKSFSPTQAVDLALRMEDEGAAIVDIGGESTRPYSEPVDKEEEKRRVEPVLKALDGRLGIPVSIDTSKSEVAELAIEAGAEIINDVTGMEDPSLVAVARDSGAGVCAMHMQGNPQNMQDDPQYQDVVAEILDYLKQRDTALLDAGIEPAKICLDPGIGFGKSHEHNLQLVRSAEQFHQLDRPILVGHSRKGFVGKILGDKNADRTFGTLGLSLFLATKTVQILRVHDVKATVQSLMTFKACFR